MTRFWQLLTQYYGVDWMAMFLTLGMLYYLARHHRAGFLFGIGASLCWLTFGLLAGSVANCVANVVFIGLNLRGYIKWTHDADSEQ